MTREERTSALGNLRYAKRWKDKEGLADETIDVCIKILEQEACEDAIRRQDVLDLAKKGVLVSNGNYESVCKAVNKLPSVNPQPKTGHWIHFANSDDCSECGWSTGKYISPSKYCPNCGAKMQEDEE